MGKQYIKIKQLFNAPVDTIFNILTDHEAFGEVINTNMERIVNGQGDNKNGVGSVRRVKAAFVPAFEETVITLEPNKLMEYVVSKGSPIKNHKGKMKFENEQGKTRLNYTIYFEPKFSFPFLGIILKKVIEAPLRKGLEQLAQKFESRE